MISNIPKQNYNLKPYLSMLRGEQKAYFMKYSDVANMNYKLLIDYDKPYGLLSDEENTNSALNYLKQIGEDTRYEMLKIWIENLKILVRDYEFLFLLLEGLDTIQNRKFGHFPVPEDRLNFGLRDTVDLRVQGLITNYRAIVYDDVRGVEVLPINLRRLDFSIIVYIAGYYNMFMYDSLGYDENDVHRRVFPTIRKLSDSEFNYRNLGTFNNIIFDVYDAELMVDESGKSFVSDISNESLEMARSNLNFSYRFANVNGNFNNNYGVSNYANLLAVMSDLHKNMDGKAKSGGVFANFINNIGDRVKDKFSDLTNKQTYSDAGKKILQDTISLGEQKLSNLDEMIFSKVSVTGDVWNKISVDYAQQMVQNTINLNVNKAEDRFLKDPLTKLNNILFNNFSSSLYDAFSSSNNSNNSIELIQNQPREQRQYNGRFDSNTQYDTTNNIHYSNQNVYKRNGI